MACIFCDIVARTAPALILYEDDHTLGFLPLEPEVAGHTLLVPKAHHADIYATPEDVLGALMTASKTLALRWREQVGATGINVLHASGVDAEQSVFHVHLHVFPRFAHDGLDAWPVLPRPAQTREAMHAAFRIAQR
ncbi:MAG: HIT domain-containing protein [Kofleriaceae bacterium]